jgi:putative endonuclease
MAFWVYILASKRNGTLYTGHTDDLPHRVWQHKEGQTPGFASKYGATILVWVEAHPTREAAKTRERQIKEWRRAWKLRLIEMSNPDWKDLSLDLNNWYPYRTR